MHHAPLLHDLRVFGVTEFLQQEENTRRDARLELCLCLWILRIEQIGKSIEQFTLHHELEVTPFIHV